MVLFAVVLVLPFLVLIGIGFRNKFESDRTHAMSLLQARRSTAEQLVNNYLGRVKLMLGELDRLPVTQDLKSPHLKETCQQFLALHPEFINVAVIDRAGNLLYSTLTAVTNPPQNFAQTAPMVDLLDARDFKVSNAALGITTALPTKEVYHDAWRNLLSALGAIAFVLFFSALIVTYCARSIARPIAALADAARAQTGGRSEVLAQVTGPHEIAATAQAFNDMIQARQAAESSLRRTEGRLDLALEGAELGLWEWHIPTGQVITNTRWSTMLEYSSGEVEPSLAAWEKLLHPDDQTRVHEVLRKHLAGEIVIYETEHRLRAKSGRWVWVLDRGRIVERDAEGKPLRAAGTHLDITARKEAEVSAAQLQKKLQETQKLESLGILAGGIAHDFNNLLTGVLGHASLAKLDLPPGAAARQNLDQIEISARRAAELCRQMLAYSGKGHFVIQRLDLNQIVEDCTHLLQISISKQCVLRTNFTRPLPTISADATQVRQIIMNLVINASEAIGTRSGVIALTTGIVRADRDYLHALRFTPDIPTGDYVFVEISDNGCGMDEATITQIFDPFFTTKFTGRGLGLAAVLGIMRGHRGGVKVYSEPSRGTTFKILFPCVTGSAEDADQPLAPQIAWRGHGTVLIVDDEETVRTVAARMLESLGFAVVLAEHGRDGFEKFQLEPTRYDLVLLDLTMPHMDGQETFRHLRALRPAVKILLMSGFNQQEAISRFAGKGLAGFVQKPFELATLASEIRRVLESPHAPA